MIKLVLCTSTLILLSGCVFHEKATLLSEPEPRPETEDFFEDNVTPAWNKPEIRSIGDIVVDFERIYYSEEQAIETNFYPLTKAPSKGWVKTHQYQGLDVYTNPNYYDGGIGIVLDNQERVFLVVQVGGARQGRRWRGSNTPFFGRVKLKADSWKVRYSGRAGTSYKFEIVDYRDQSQSETAQVFEVSESDYLKGFIVRGVFVQGLDSGEYGTINYILKDVTN